MSKYLKLFNQDAEYQAFKETEEYILPNVSYVKADNVVYYNPFETVKLGVIMARYNATEENMLALADTSNVKSLKVNGSEVEFGDMYHFNEVGEYDVEIELIDPTLINGMRYDENYYPISNSMFWVILNNQPTGACLTSVVIPDSVTSIGEMAFACCSGLNDIHIGSGVTEIGGSAFYYCTSLTSVNIPDSVTSIGTGAFSYCSGLTEVHISLGVTSVGSEAFAHCTSLTSINIPDSVTSIGESAFAHCTSLTSINIPDSVTSIGESAFYSCLGLNEITCNAITPPSISNWTFQRVKSGGILKVPEGSDYSSWMSTDEFYLGYYNWTIEYI